MSRSTKWKFAIIAGVNECLVYAEAKYCAFEIHGEPKYYVCPRTEYCCNFGCCVSPGFQIYHLWYYWLLVIIMFLVCSGGGWWYRYWLQGRYRAAASAIPTRSYSTRTQSSLRGPTCQAQQARISYNTARNTVLLHRMWKGPHRSVTSPAYGSAAAATSAAHHYQNTSVVLNDANCPYYQLYGPPPSYETVIAQTRGKVSTPSSPELLRGPSPRNTASATAFVGPPCFYGLPPPSAAPHYQPLTCNQTPPPAFESAEYGYEPRPLSFGQRVHYVQCTANAAAGKSSTENSDADNSIAHYGQDSPEEGGFSASSSSMLPRNDCASGSCAVLGTTLPCSYAPKWNTRIGVHGQHQLRDRTKIDSTISPQSLELMPDQPIATTSSDYGASTSSAMSHPPTRRKIQGGSLKMPRRREQQAKHYESVRVLAAANRRLSSASSSTGTGCTVPLGREVDQTYHQSSPSSNVITAETFDNERVTQQQQQQQQHQQQQLTGHAQQPASSTNLNCESKRKLDRSRSLE
ncbi:uncharacterized protein LOC106649974 isoform X2 [Trichogramma pretiosum]|uniref:uncharacterized protein LOC106649974 isoform X2 n=1 Tax=Trichogramma pretiosum TaxID=7493 RepID=UPI000C718D41|nr:uncharacterized protein LOC106649974 isoform X2 [Trichogramma pretiosum]